MLRIVQGRKGDDRFHVRGYIDEGTTTTPFDMVVVNMIDRFHLAMDALERSSRLRASTTDVVDLFAHKLTEHEVYTREHLVDLPEIVNWRWTDDFSEPSEPPPPAIPAPPQTFTNA